MRLTRTVALRDYAIELEQHPIGPCTLCDRGQRKYFVYDPDIDNVAYLCKHCYKRYNKHLENLFLDKDK